MITKKVLFVTGAGRGLGIDIAKAALAAGHAVVATGRNTERVSAALGAHDDLLVVKLDVTSLDDAKAAARAAVDRFGRIDVLVNNAGNFYAGFFEEISPQDFRSQIETAMFGVEGFIESLAPEVAPFGIRTMLVEPGFFRTELLTPESTKFAEPSIDDYAERTSQTVTAWKGMNGLQGGDPAKLADALVQLASQDEPPRRFAAGADSVAAVEQKATDPLTQAGAYRELSSNLAHDDAAAA